MSHWSVPLLTVTSEVLIVHAFRTLLQAAPSNIYSTADRSYTREQTMQSNWAGPHSGPPYLSLLLSRTRNAEMFIEVDKMFIKRLSPVFSSQKDVHESFFWQLPSNKLPLIKLNYRNE